MSEEEDAKVARLSFLVFVAVPPMSGVNIFSQGTATDTPDVDVDALSILGRSTGTLEAGALSMGSCWVRSLLHRERPANPSFKG